MLAPDDSGVRDSAERARVCADYLNGAIELRYARVMQAEWRVWALASAFFAALTAVLAKAGVSTVSSNLATVARTRVVFALG